MCIGFKHYNLKDADSLKILDQFIAALDSNETVAEPKSLNSNSVPHIFTKVKKEKMAAIIKRPKNIKVLLSCLTFIR
jgi:hypothetical protein